MTHRERNIIATFLTLALFVITAYSAFLIGEFEHRPMAVRYIPMSDVVRDDDACSCPVIVFRGSVGI